jgi:hypothetical protein
LSDPHRSPRVFVTAHTAGLGEASAGCDLNGTGESIGWRSVSLVFLGDLSVQPPAIQR